MGVDDSIVLKSDEQLQQEQAQAAEAKKDEMGEYDLYMDGDNGGQNGSCPINRTPPDGNEWNLILAPRNDDNNLYVGYISEFRIYQGNISKRDMPQPEDVSTFIIET